MSKTRTQQKDEYNEKAYTRYTIRIRKDSDLHEKVEEFMSKSGTSMNYLVTKLLNKHFLETSETDIVEKSDML